VVAAPADTKPAAASAAAPAVNTATAVPAAASVAAPVKPAAEPAKATPAPVPVATAVAPASPVALPPGATKLKFVFAESSWVEVKDAKGQLLVSNKHAAGSEREIGGVGPLSVTIGNASHVRLQVNGKPVDLQPSANDVARLTLP
jgi:cytoskeleton protein RodZ